jgi:hypothetical protein
MPDESPMGEAPQPVAWRFRIGMQNLWSYTETEEEAWFYLREPAGGGAKYELQALYLAPTASPPQASAPRRTR